MVHLTKTAATGGIAAHRNRNRFIAVTGKTEADYDAWASQVGRQMHINTLDRMICARLGIYTVAHLPHLATRLPDAFWDEAQLDEYLLTHSENPLEIARIWRYYTNEARMYLSVESVLAEHLNAFPKDDFERWGDPNYLSDVSKSWFKRTGANLDVQVQEINEVAPIPVTIDDIIAFVRQWRPKAYQSPAQGIVERIEERFKELTTFRIKDYYAEHLIRMATFSHQPADYVPF
jgi:hypothetical protein